VHHVFARGNGKRDIFLVERDRVLYLRLMGQVVVRQRWHCLAYCLMDNHMHMLVETPQANLGAGMGRLQGLYAQTFNKRHGRCGHVFGGRFGSVLVRTDEQLLTVARYIALNPVEAGLCEEAAAWPWGSHAALVTGAAPAWLDAARLLAYFGAAGGDPEQRYAEFVR
jgi:REP-associated tyrosine transposase